MVACKSLFAVMPVMAAAGNFNLNVDKLTDFTTDVTLTGEGVENPMLHVVMNDLAATYHVEFDLVNEEFKVTYEGGWTAQAWPSYGYNPDTGYAVETPGPTLGAVYGAGEIVLVNGVVGLKEAANATDLAGKQELAYCFKADVPPGALPSGSALKSMVESKVPMAEQRLNSIQSGYGRTVTISNGVATIEQVGYLLDVTIVMGTDGTPMSFDYNNTRESMRLSIEFTDWTEGTSEIDEPQCLESLPSSLAEHRPGFSLVLLQTLAEKFSQNEATAEMGMYLSNAAMTLNGMMYAEQQVTPTTTWQSMLVPFTAGMSGAAVLLALTKIFKGKRVRSEPLLSNA